MARSGGDLMFIGEYNHVIDAKGRLIIPAKFRETLGDNFVVTKGLDGCLFVYDNTEWSAFEDRLKMLPLINKEARKFVRFFGRCRQCGGRQTRADIDTVCVEGVCSA